MYISGIGEYDGKLDGLRLRMGYSIRLPAISLSGFLISQLT